ncbi:MAG: TIGR03619 family F420-dependent LLM class oxidoreductase [Acidimicrobiales bacterium]
MYTAVPIVPEGQLAYGMQLPIQAQSTMFVADWERQAGAPELTRVARAAEDAGFFYVATCDHIAIPERLAPAMGTHWYDVVATLGFLAGITSRIRLLSHVYVPTSRHPLIGAKSFATLDALSNGRVILGVGAGHVAEEFEALGADFARRGALLDEAIDLMALALEEEFPTFTGPTWPVSGVGARPRPVQSPRPPIWIGGSSPAALRRVAERGDGWLPQGTPRDQMADQIAFINEHRQRIRGDDPIDLGVITEWLYVGKPSFEIDPTAKTGSGAEIAEALNQFGAMGVNHLQVRFPARSCDELCDQIAAFGSEVAPHLRVG